MVALRLEMDKKTRAWRRMESQERLNLVSMIFAINAFCSTGNVYTSGYYLAVLTCINILAVFCFRNPTVK